MNVLLLIASHGRDHITPICYEGVKRIVKLYELNGVFVHPFIACSSDSDMDIAKRFGLKCAIFPNDPLGNKMNLALRYAWQTEYDYLMQLGSDDLMLDEGVLFTTAYMKQGVEMFGFTGTYVIEYETLKCKIYEGSTVWGSGRFIHSRIVNDLKGKLWTPMINKGLDNDSRARIASNCRAKPMQLKTPKPCIIDIKTKGQNLNSFDSFGSVYVTLEDFTPEIITLKATAKSNALKNPQ